MYHVCWALGSKVKIRCNNNNNTNTKIYNAHLVKH